METCPSTSRILPYLLPFFTLSYPTDTPSNTDSFHDAQYYRIGPLDACFLVTWISVMAVLRDVIRLAVLEPFARWKLLRDLDKKVELEKQRHVVVMNGNGHHAASPPSKRSRRESRRIHRSVLRFAEQGWAALYYAVQWTYGIVRRFSSVLFFFADTTTVCSP
jgi:acyl-CoA-dependent ceramide synthase